MKYILSISIVLASLGISAQNNIQWMTWEEVDSARQEEPRKIFVDVYTDWCGWCKRMDASTFKDPNVVGYMNQKYYAVKFNAERRDTVIFNNRAFPDLTPQRKRGTNALAYSLLEGRMSYPSFVILDENLQRAHIISGYKKPEPFLANLMFFGSNEYVPYNKYFMNEVKKQQEQQQNAQPQPQQGQQNKQDTRPPAKAAGAQ